MTIRRSHGPLERQLHRQRLLQTAVGAFARHGIGDTTIDDILEATRVSRRTFYRYFQGRDDLLVELFTVSCQLLLRAIRDEIGRGPDATRVERCVEVYLGFRDRAGAIVHELEAEALRSGSPLEPVRRELLDAASNELARALVDDSGGQVDPIVVHGVLVAIEGISHRMRAPAPYTMERARAAMLRIARAALSRPGEAVPALPML